ncbi:hypothetical protein HPP92_012499 [Vanilla planifolia]|uniref:Uncharacterized protein n=1 Tax=Vanilla planifolia TaxID=51239 RepID=A0A835QX38_VANPL|nr:hypothetical protein HPP92_012893 [Vanilla planifolia]KAG0477780.1 hypothetical protein HPP92_012499 [Vanilla planifolia]
MSSMASRYHNPLWLILPKGTQRSPKLVGLQASFEQSLAEILRNLKPHDNSSFHSMLWTRQAIDALFVSRKLVKTLMADLEFPSSLWDDKWVQSYMNDSVKFLDLCIAFISEVSRLEQQQILLKYVQHILDPSCSPSSEQLKRATGALSDWTQKLQVRTQKLKEVPSVLQELERTLCLPKVKKSDKGKVLMRAFYAFKVVMMFISNVLFTQLSGCSKPLLVLQVLNDFQWSEAFNDLQATVNRELKSSLSLQKPIMLRELDQVDASSRCLNGIIIDLLKEAIEKQIDGNVAEEARRRYGEPMFDLSKGTKCLSLELELLEKRLDKLFRLLMSERSDMLDGLRASEKERM